MFRSTSLTRLLAHPQITSTKSLVRYVCVVTAISLAIALCLDIASQLVFFTNWETALRSWALTVLSVCVIAVPVSTIFARSQRALLLAHRELEVLSSTDQLTGLPNRRALIEASELSDFDTMVLVIADVDRFKTINDTIGHRGGDAVICAVGQIMAKHLSQFGIVGRLGGDEFALISTNAPIEDIVLALIKLCEAVSKTSIIAADNAVKVSISAGIAIRDPSISFDTVYSEADEALYMAKRAGRNRIELSERVKLAYSEIYVRSASG
ncbi:MULTISPECIES: GGDEF domain-containing protein [unclassified Chelatococcus]|uniref:GGDEF domain-containing protein n=1 Tax=unclassified Chelatococcus TaxID=2638111 RepID=UPI001BCAB70B|nr:MULTISPECIES: GGDEF domain-containing protein [unclassified Chelatococcus]MBS7699206.1 GGDEF domain-containing protein [Chelatococcus sp. YT9]MBX3554987.1 GGDEF domain-containing protein [Chelatococcus sp.]